jgi:PEP-CTERM motif-containing protein
MIVGFCGVNTFLICGTGIAKIRKIKILSMKLKITLLIAMAIAMTTIAQAQTGTLGLVDVSTPSVGPGTDINSATTYTIGDLASFSDSTGIFAGLSSQIYGPVTFEPGIGDSFSFGSSVFGTFTSTSITLETSSQGFVSLHILGDYTSGSFDGDAVVNKPVSVDYSFTQNPVIDGGISDSGEFSIPPSSVPEPASLALLGMGGIAACMRLGHSKA